MSGTITLSSGDIAISEAVDLFGPGSAKLNISGNNSSRIFTIGDSDNTAFHVGITGMTLRNGNVTTGSSTSDGGAIFTGRQELELRDVNCISNKAINGGAIFLGSQGRLTILNSAVSGNTALDSGGGIYANSNSVSLITLTNISGNLASSGSGGGINVDVQSTLVLQTSTIGGNFASNSGGGVRQVGNGRLTIENSTISNNSCVNAGGGIYAGYAEAHLINSTISGNQGGNGGGIYLNGNSYNPSFARSTREPVYFNAPATIDHSTIASNTAVGNSASGTGGGVFSLRRVDLANSIVALNTANFDPDLHGRPVIGPGDIAQGNGNNSQPTFFASFCLIQNASQPGVLSDLGGNIFNVAPLLAILQNNGGATPTRALLTGSRGINEGNPSFAGPPPTDQRGFPRIASGRLDIGAFEVQPGKPTVPSINLNAVGSGPRGDSTVRVYDNAGKLLITFQPYDTTFKGEIHVATGDLDGDFVEDVITGAGAGGGPHVQVFSGARLLGGVAERIVSALGSYFAYNPGFRGGVNVSAGDVNGDGKADIVTGAGPGGGPHVVAWDVQTGKAITSFYAYNMTFGGGVTVGAGDVDNDGFAEIVTGAGPGGGPHVRQFNRFGNVVREFFAYDASFTGGVFVAGGDVNGDGRADIVTGAGAGASPHVKVFDGTSLALIRSFNAFESIFTGGVRVATANLDADANVEIIVGAGPLGGPHVRFVDNDSNSTQLNSFYSIDKNFNGGIFVG